MGKQKILVVDDLPQNLQLMRQVLSDQYQLSFATDGKLALAAAEKHMPDLILMDVMMPNMDGYEACRELKKRPDLQHIPVVFVTAMGEEEDEKNGFDAGGVDYITKPIKAPIVKRRVQTHLSLVRVEELEKSRLLIIERLGRAAEFKDNQTGLHVIRMSHYSKMLAEKCGMSESWCKQLFLAAPMHDIGKIGISDSIILKPGPLNDDEWEVMKKHPEMGADIIGHHDSELLAMAHRIALNHHEKWDGSGYPNGVAGEDIPLEARIIAIADVFDALTTKRPYKEAWEVPDALAHLEESAGSHLDPHLVKLFTEIMDDILMVMDKWSENSA
ncbi:MAG: HD domain-containing phosphohydrolase [Desulfovibrio sp.]